MNSKCRLPLFITLATAIALCVGCGGGGGGGTPAVPLTLSATSPTLTGKTGQTVNLPVSVAGTGTVKTASFEVHFDSGLFAPAGTTTVGGPSVAVAGTASGVAARYKWINAQTIKVLYASANGVSSGSLLVNVPVKVNAETDSTIAVQNALLNQ